MDGINTGKTSEEGAWICPSCGEENDRFFCTNCGMKRAVQQAKAASATEKVYGGGDDLKPEGIWDYEGVWLNRDGSVRLVIGQGRVTRYHKNDRTGGYDRDSSDEAAFAGGSLHPAGDDKTCGLTGYFEMEKKGELLYAAIAMPDVKPAVEVFAREGHGNDFPPLPEYVKVAEEVSDRRLDSLVLSSKCFDADRTGGFLFSALPGFEAAVSLDLRVSVSQLTGERQVSGEICARPQGQANFIGMMGGMGAMGRGSALRKVNYPLTEELEKKLSGVLLSPAVLERNPYHERNDMMRPTVHFTLEAVFASGERISMDTKYGIPIGSAAVELAGLLLGVEP